MAAAMARGEKASVDLGRNEFGLRCEAGDRLSRIVLIGWKLVPKETPI